jgi:hypothetical protein
MNLHGKRRRLGGVLIAVALGAIAMLALPAIGVGKHGNDDAPRAAGTVGAFDPGTGALTVDLADGGSITALVVRRTQIRCGKGPTRLRGHGARSSRRGAEEPGDRGRSGEPEPGDDRGGRGLEPGDDRGQQGERPQGPSALGDGGAHGRGHHGERCNASDLVPGAVVMKAEIVLTHGDALFKKVGLLPPRPATAG